MMGDMADMALEDVCTMEGLRDDYFSGFMSAQDAFEIGFLDPLGQETGFLNGKYPTTPTSTYTDVNTPLQVRSKGLGLSSEQKRSDNRKKTREYLKGFTKFYMERGFLSKKQKAIIDANFPGGAEAFINMLEGER